MYRFEEKEIADSRRTAIEVAGSPFVLTGDNGITKVDVIAVVGRGGTSLCYKGIKRGRGMEGDKAVIIKEYYPVELPEGSKFSYRRGEDGKLKIEVLEEYLVKLEERKQIIEEELIKRDNNVKRECVTAQKLFFDVVKSENSADMDQVSILKKGDENSTTYVIIDTQEGCTLRNLLNRRAEGTFYFGIKGAIKYIRELLFVLEKLMFEKDYVHGDLKPENIYISGHMDDVSSAEDREVNIKILDFGSVFCKAEYSYDDIHQDDSNYQEKIEKAAADIMANEGLGYASSGYKSPQITRRINARSNYYANPNNFVNAQELVRSTKNVDESADCFSIMQIFIELIIGRIYPSDGSITKYDLKQLLRKNEKESNIKYLKSTVAFLEKMCRKMVNEHYKTPKEIRKDIAILEEIYTGGGHPSVMLEKTERKQDTTEIESVLFGEIDEIKL